MGKRGRRARPETPGGFVRPQKTAGGPAPAPGETYGPPPTRYTPAPETPRLLIGQARGKTGSLARRRDLGPHHLLRHRRPRSPGDLSARLAAWG